MRASRAGGGCCGSPTDMRIGGSFERGVTPASSSPSRVKGLSASRASLALAGNDESSIERAKAGAGAPRRHKAATSYAPHATPPRERRRDAACCGKNEAQPTRDGAIVPLPEAARSPQTRCNPRKSKRSEETARHFHLSGEKTPRVRRKENCAGQQHREARFCAMQRNCLNVGSIFLAICWPDATISPSFALQEATHAVSWQNSSRRGWRDGDRVRSDRGAHLGGHHRGGDAGGLEPQRRLQQHRHGAVDRVVTETGRRPIIGRLGSGRKWGAPGKGGAPLLLWQEMPPRAKKRGCR